MVSAFTRIVSVSIFLFLVFLGLQSRAESLNTRIYGGRVSTESDTVALLVEGQKGVKGLYICTGTFLTSTKFLTAKHCVAKNGFKSPKFVILTSPKGPAIQVKKIQKSSSLDLAILTVNPVKVVPAPIMLSRSVVVGEEIEFYGYGQDEKQKTAVERSASKFLKVGSGNLSNLDGAYYYFTNTTAGGACPGDSGGPLVALNSNNEVGVIGVANAVASKTKSNKCAVGNFARYTSVTQRAALTFIAANAPDAKVD